MSSKPENVTMTWAPEQPYNALTALMPNPAMLVNTLPMLEARDSSEIENIVTTADRQFQTVGNWSM